MPDTASNSHDRDRARDSRFTQIDGFRDQERGQSAAPSTLSLSMMREAFGGLRSNTERSTSSTEQRGELERSKDVTSGHDRVPNAFKEESYSYRTVEESVTDIPSSGFESPSSDARSHGIAQITSVEFFDYLIAIGGL